MCRLILTATSNHLGCWFSYPPASALRSGPLPCSHRPDSWCSVQHQVPLLGILLSNLLTLIILPLPGGSRTSLAHKASPAMWSYHKLTSLPDSTAWSSKYHYLLCPSEGLAPPQLGDSSSWELDLPSSGLGNMSCLLQYIFLLVPVL